MSSQWFCIQLIRFGQPYAAVSVFPTAMMVAVLPSVLTRVCSAAKLQRNVKHLGPCSILHGESALRVKSGKGAHLASWKEPKPSEISVCQFDSVFLYVGWFKLIQCRFNVDSMWNDRPRCGIFASSMRNFCAWPMSRFRAVCDGNDPAPGVHLMTRA